MKGFIRSVLIFLKGNFKEVVIFLVVAIILKKLAEAKIVNTNPDENLSDEDKLEQGKATITDIQAKSYAEELYKGLVTEGLSDSYKLILPVFKKLKNQEDFNKVYNAFGKTQYSDWAGNMGDPFTSRNRDLIHILQNEPDSNLGALRMQFPWLEI